MVPCRYGARRLAARDEPSFAHVKRYFEITTKNGVIQQSNFNDYPVARITEAPYQTNVHIVETRAPPAGVEEAGVAAVRAVRKRPMEPSARTC
jgi:hypothetical protein